MPKLDKFLSMFRDTNDAISQGPAQEVNAPPSGRDLAAASIPQVQNPKGVWEILAQVARMRGQNRLSSLFAAKEEQERQLKNRETESQIGSREANNQYLDKLGKNMDADNARAEEDAQWTRAARHISALESSQGDVTGVKKNVAPTFGPEGYEAAGSEGKTDLLRENPEVELPTGDKVRPRTAQQKLDAQTDAKIQEELYKTHNIGPDSRAINVGLGMDITNRKQIEGSEEYQLWKSQLGPGEDSSIEAFWRARTKGTERDPSYDEPLMRYETFNDSGDPVQRFGTRGELRGKEFPAITAELISRNEAKRRLAPMLSKLKALSEKVINKVGLMQMGQASLDQIQARLMNDPDFLTYQDVADAAAIDIATVKQGGRSVSDQDRIAERRRIPDPLRDDARSRALKWEFIDSSLGISNSTPQANQSPISFDRATGTVTIQTPTGPKQIPIRPQGKAQ